MGDREDWMKRDAEAYAQFDNPPAYYMGDPPMIERGEGYYLYDVDGTKYVDMVAGFAALAFGHCNEDLIKPTVEQLHKLVHVSNLPNTQRVELAEKLLSYKPVQGEARVYFDIGGASGADLARRAVEAFTKKPKMIAFKYGFHGSSLAALSLMDPAKFQGLFHVPHNAILCEYPYYYQHGGDPDEYDEKLLEKVRRTIEQHRSEVGGLILEPALGSSGYVFPSAKFFQGIRQICDDYNIVMVDDEVQMGFYRTGKRFCADHYGVKPDIMLLGKALGGGGIHPISATVMRADIAKALPPKTFTSTFCGNPLGSGLGLKTLEYMEELDLGERVTKMGEYLQAKLKELMETHGCIGEVAGKGLAVSVEFVEDRETRKPLADSAYILTKLGRQEGLLLKPGSIKNRVMLSPYLLVTEAEIDEFIERFDATIRRAEAADWKA